MRSVSIPDAGKIMDTYCLAGLVPFLKGAPGIGKSAAVKEFAKNRNLYLVDIRLAQCDPTDLSGFPAIDKEKNKAYYVPMSMFPLEGDPIPEGYSGWCLFFDELNGADRGTQKASYKVFLDKQVGQANIHKKVIMIAAGNNETDNALVEELSSALQSRLVHIQVHSYAPAWLSWADTKEIAHEIKSFVSWNPQNLNTFDPDNQGDEPTYACERTWDMVSKVLMPKLSATGQVIKPAFDPRGPLALETLSGIIGEGKATEFLGYLRIFKDLPTIKNMQDAPTTTTMPTAPGTLYALSGVIGHGIKEANAAALITFVRRMAQEYQVITMRSINANNPKLIRTQSIKDWIADNNTEMFAA